MLLILRKKQVMEGINPITEHRLTSYLFTTLADQYDTWAIRQRAYHTSKKYFIASLRDYFGACAIKNLTVQMIEEYQSKLLNSGKSKATVNRHVACLKHMLTKAVEWEMVQESVLQKIRKVKMIAEQNQRLRFLSEEECQAVVNACSQHLKPIVITALNTGMRKEEILSLCWDKHVDLKHRFILLDKTKNDERREIPINDALRSTLQSLVRRLDSPYVFTDSAGQRFGDVKKGFQAACSRAGIKDFTFHDLRHTFASHLIMAGVDLPTVKELLGHKTLAMTLRYAHLAPSHKAQAVSVLHNRLKIVAH